MTSLPPFLTLWILVQFPGPLDEDILMIKVQTKHGNRPKTLNLRFNLLMIKKIWGFEPMTSVNDCEYMKVIYLNCDKDINMKVIFAIMNTS